MIQKLLIAGTVSCEEVGDVIVEFPMFSLKTYAIVGNKHAPAVPSTLPEIISLELGTFIVLYAPL